MQASTKAWLIVAGVIATCAVVIMAVRFIAYMVAVIAILSIPVYIVYRQIRKKININQEPSEGHRQEQEPFYRARNYRRRSC